jgi:hypothetical protein
MENKNLIPIKELCLHYNIEFSFVQALNEYGLVKITTINNDHFIFHEQVKPLEKMIRLHYELEINLEGIEAIAGLLQRIDDLQEQLRITRNKLKRFESE